jgi:methylase of polypeptide subunit release factors
MTEPPSFLIHDADVPNLRAVVSKLAGFGYSESSVRDRLGLEDVGDLQWRAVPMYRSEHLVSRDLLALAIDLFLLQGALPTGEFDRLFSPSERDVLVRAAIIARDEMGVARARASLFPVGDRLIFSDHAWPELPHPGYDSVPYDQVMSVGRDSRNLARCTIRRPFSSALDLCTGSGIHAVLASAHSEQVLAIDINPRAAHCTRFNAQASGITNLKVAVGDLFDILPNKRFDLITANPPFVPSPLGTLAFRDGGPSGEDIQKRIIASLPDHLEPGGIAQIVTELGERDGEPLVHRLREWLNGAAMDIHILRLGEHNATQYAIGHAKGNDYQACLEATDQWASNLRAQGYKRVVSLVISFQWSDAKCGSPWERVDESPPPRRNSGTNIHATFLAERRTRHLDWPQSLRHNRVCRTGPVALFDARVLGSDLPATTKATLLGQALRVEHQIDPVEREILNRVECRIVVSDLIAIFRFLHVDEPIVIAALRSLLRCKLIRIDE